MGLCGWFGHVNAGTKIRSILYGTTGPKGGIALIYIWQQIKFESLKINPHFLLNHKSYEINLP